MQKITEFCMIQNIVDFIKTSKKYKVLNPYQKEKLLVQLFHSCNWEVLKKEDRIVILQELENACASKLKRTPYQMVVLKNNYKWNEFVMDMGTKFKESKIFIRNNWLMDGIGQSIENGKIVETKINFLNVELLNDLFHEQYHIMREHFLNKYKQTLLLYKEHLEYLIWFRSYNQSKEGNQVNRWSDYYKYRMEPDEYYAYLYAERKISNVFSALRPIYGEDENFYSALKYEQENEKYALHNYREHFPQSGIGSYEELYNQKLEEYIKEFSVLENITLEEVKKSLTMLPSIIQNNL